MSFLTVVSPTTETLFSHDESFYQEVYVKTFDPKLLDHTASQRPVIPVLAPIRGPRPREANLDQFSPFKSNPASYDIPLYILGPSFLSYIFHHLQNIMSSETKPVIIVGAGLAGLVAAFELAERKIPVLLIDQENEQNLGGQAFWSLGGVFMVDSSYQRRMGIKDSRELAMRDWFGSARFDREEEDHWPRKWAKAFVDFATDEMEDFV